MEDGAVAGALAGALHAVTGPDHIAALLPLCMGRRWWESSRTGLQWGLGHGLGASFMGFLAFSLKGLFDIHALSNHLEAMVGVTLIAIGVLGMHRARQLQSKLSGEGADSDDESEGLMEMEERAVCDDTPPSTTRSRAKSESRSRGLMEHLHTDTHHHHDLKSLSAWAMLGTGIFHGFSGSGHLLGVMPALTLPSFAAASSYLVSFCLGTMLAMALFTGVMGELSFTLGKSMERPDLPIRLCQCTSVFAMCMGVIWILKTVVPTTDNGEYPGNEPF